MPQPPLSFTFSFKGIKKQIINDIFVSPAFNPVTTKPIECPKGLQCKALWDTGATNCAITKSLAKKLGLGIVDFATVKHAQGSSSNVNVYDVNIILPNKLGMSFLRVSEMEDKDDNFDFIIGMNVISMGDFAISNLGGNTMISFRFPSQKSIDFCHDSSEQSMKDSRDKFLKYKSKSKRY